MHLQNHPGCFQKNASGISTSSGEHFHNQKVSERDFQAKKHWQYPVFCEDKIAINCAKLICNNTNASSCVSPQRVLSSDLFHTPKETPFLFYPVENYVSKFNTEELRQEREARIAKQERMIHESHLLKCFNSEDWQILLQGDLSQEFNRLQLGPVNPGIVVWEDSQIKVETQHVGGDENNIFIAQYNHETNQEQASLCSLSVPSLTITDEKRRPPMPTSAEGVFSG
ncbi:uncharacterized protein LOC106477902 [Limulus polyphemus]|uniref:Uncharacterized protein LOC106477902 n=1 Tax=Limulus polyphemus TaxID=6850 RepID=A0ABM1C4A6_LIMPO|nr:uncharacterized protein LOC106477902 [Limulus polyphemus]